MDKFLIRKDVYGELIEKGYGKKDLSKLTKKKITDKNGHTRTVYVRNGEQPATQQQPKAQDELSSEKKARYEEMLEKVVAGPDDNALFVKGKGMLNKKEAIAHLSEKLGKHADAAISSANDKANNLTSMSKEDKIAILSEYMHKKYSSVSVEDWKKTYNAKLSDKELDEAFKDFSETHQETIKEYQKNKPVSSAAQGHLESDEPMNTDITAEDEARFGKEALSGLSGKRTGSEESSKNKADSVKEWMGKGLSRDAAYVKVAYDDLYNGFENKTAEEKQKINKTFQDIQKNGTKAEYFKEHAEEYGLESPQANKDYKSEVKRALKMGLPADAAYAKVAMDSIEEELKTTKDEDARKELIRQYRDVQMHNIGSEYIQSRKKEFGL